ncbi:MAG: restriction endonuclease subunit S, partial [Pseudomonas sp. PGPPP3]
MRIEALSTVVAALESGTRPKGGASGDTGTVPSLGGEHLSNDGGFRLDNLKYIDEQFFVDLKKGAIKTNDILIVKDGATTGKVSYVGSDFPFERAAINEHLFALTIDSKIANPRYVFSFLKSPQGQREILKDFRGAAIGGISRGFVDLAKIPLPSLDDQIRIAHLLGKVEGLIAQRKQHLQQLNVLLKSVFLVMFDDLKISEGESTLEDCLKIQQGFAFKSEEFIDSGTPIIKIGTVNKGFFDYSTLSFIADNYPEKIRRFEIKPGDLLISLTGTVGKDDYGNTCFVPSNAAHHTYLLNQRVGKLVCDRNVAHPIFIDSLLKLPKVKSALIKQNRGVRQANLSNSDIYGIQLSIPPIDQQRQFAVIVEKVEAIKSSYQKILADLEALYGALSQQAFKGQLDLSRVPLLGIEPEKEKTVAAEPLQIPAEESLAIHLPDTDSLLAALESAKARKNLLAQWLEAYRGQLDSTPFSVQHFMAAAQ